MACRSCARSAYLAIGPLQGARPLGGREGFGSLLAWTWPRVRRKVQREPAIFRCPAKTGLAAKTGRVHSTFMGSAVSALGHLQWSALGAFSPIPIGPIKPGAAGR
jgi:hypothetical protein